LAANIAKNVKCKNETNLKKYKCNVLLNFFLKMQENPIVARAPSWTLLELEVLTASSEAQTTSCPSCPSTPLPTWPFSPQASALWASHYPYVDPGSTTK